MNSAGEPGGVIVIMGPTASGKTAYAVSLAREIDAEIVSADSMQIYRGMDIGTAKATEKERGGVPHHMIDVANPDERFSVADYKRMAEICIDEILARGKKVIVVGGTGLYISALVYNIRYTDFAVDQSIRSALLEESETIGLPSLYRRLLETDPTAAAKINEHDKKRIIRALEVYLATGETITSHEKKSRLVPPRYAYSLFCLDVPRAELYKRTDTRVDDMFACGLLQEARTLFERYGKDKGTALQAIGYKELMAYFAGESDLDECRELIKRETRRYVKRQLTWFRRMKDVEYIST